MPQHVSGVVARETGAAVELATIVIPDPGPGEVVVKVQACGVCHTDLTYREGGINDEFPFLLGHAGAGVVEEVGSGAVGSGGLSFRGDTWSVRVGTVTGVEIGCRSGLGRVWLGVWDSKVHSRLVPARRY